MKAENLLTAFALGVLVATPAGRECLLALANSSKKQAPEKSQVPEKLAPEESKPATAQETKQGENNFFSRVWSVIKNERHD